MAYWKNSLFVFKTFEPSSLVSRRSGATPHRNFDSAVLCLNGRNNLQYVCSRQPVYTVELQWLEHLLNHENMLETGVVQANKC